MIDSSKLFEMTGSGVSMQVLWEGLYRGARIGWAGSGVRMQGTLRLRGEGSLRLTQRFAQHDNYFVPRRRILEVKARPWQAVKAWVLDARDRGHC